MWELMAPINQNKKYDDDDDDDVYVQGPKKVIS
jgi:hypothetical protein